MFCYICTECGQTERFTAKLRAVKEVLVDCRGDFMADVSYLEDPVIGDPDGCPECGYDDCITDLVIEHGESKESIIAKLKSYGDISDDVIEKAAEELYAKVR